MRVHQLAVWMVLLAWLGVAPADAVSQGDARHQEDDSVLENLEHAIDNSDWQKVISFSNPDGQRAAEQLSDAELYGIGMAYLNLGKPKVAKPWLEEHLKRNPNSTITIELLSDIAFRQRDTKRLQKYLEMRPGNIKVLIAAANRYVSMAESQLKKELPESHKEFSTLRNFKPGRSKANEYFDRAEAYLRQALAADPDSVDARIRMGLFQKNRGKIQESIDHLLAAEKIKPLKDNHYFVLAQLYHQRGEPHKAMEAVDLAIRLSPKLMPPTLMLRAKLHSGLGQYDKATEDLRLVFEKDHNHLTVRRDLGMAAYMDKNYPLAIFAFGQSYDVDGDMRSLAMIGQCVFELEQNEMAVAYVDKAIEKSEAKNEDFVVPSEWHFTKGRALWNLGKKTASATELLAAFQKDPNSTEKGEWALYVFKEINDPHGLIEVAYRWGMNIDHAEAFQILRHVQSHWRSRVSVNHLGEKAIGHDRRILYVTSRIYDKLGMSKTAYDAWARAYYSWSLWSGWLAVSANQSRAALRAFRVLKRSENSRTRERATAGLAFMELHDSDSKNVYKNLDLITQKELTSATLSIRALAEVLDDPNKAESLGIYDLTGIFGYYFESQHGIKGLVVKGLLPGSPLAKSSPMVRPKDVIVKIDDLAMDGFDHVEELHRRKPTNKSIKLTVRRDSTYFEVEVDPVSAAKSITQAFGK